MFWARMTLPGVCPVIAELGINHNGDLDIALRMIDAAGQAGCDAVKLQTRTPELCVPEAQRDVERDTPWGTMTYLQYKRRIEPGPDWYPEVAKRAADWGMSWLSSPWDIPSALLLERVGCPVIKVASACATDLELLRCIRDLGKPVILSTGACTMQDIETAVRILGTERLAIAHTVSTYPMRPEDANLRMMWTLRKLYPECPVGYSGHEPGLQVSIIAAAIGADFIERHITLDRSMWGTDQGASLEPDGMRRLVRDVRLVGPVLGDGMKRTLPGEEAVMRKLRRVS